MFERIEAVGKITHMRLQKTTWGFRLLGGQEIWTTHKDYMSTYLPPLEGGVLTLCFIRQSNGRLRIERMEG